MKAVLVTVCFLLPLVFPQSLPEIDKREYWAVLIGINDYSSPRANLPYSINEIKGFKKTLLSGGNWNESNILVVTDRNANKSGILNALDWLASRADSNDVSIFYYVGHGGQSSSNEYLVVYKGLISDEELDKKLDEVEGRIVVILDCCFSGGFIKEVGKTGRVVLTACKKDELSFQCAELKSGIFGYFLNLSLGKITKAAEGTFLMAFIGSLIYSYRLSQRLNGNYTMHPRIFDGTLLKVKIVNRYSFSSLPYEMFSLPVNGKIWKMS